MEQIYKNLYKDNEIYFLAMEDNTRQVVSQESYILIYILEVLLNKKEDSEIFLSNEKGETDA